MTDKPQTPFIATTRTEGTFVGLGAIAFTIIASHFVGEDRGWVAGVAAMALASILILSWPLRRERWFWAVFGSLAAVHAFAVGHFDWSFTHDWHGRAFGLLLLPDLAVMLGITYGFFRLIHGAPAELVDELPDEPRYGERDLDL